MAILFRSISRVSQRPSKLSRAYQRVKIKLTLIYLESIDEAVVVVVVEAVEFVVGVGVVIKTLNLIFLKNCFSYVSF